MSPSGPLDVLSISQLNRRAKQLLETQFSPVWVEGEISNFTHHSSGHMYLTLKDDRSELAAVMFASRNAALTFRPGEGQKVVARGSLTIYELRGQYQLVVENLYASGAGELWMALEALKSRLQEEGLFDPERKQPLPSFPRRIGVVTSPTGAAIRDIMQVVASRAPQIVLIVRPTLVQGVGAKEDIAAAVAEFDAYGEVDLVIIARGGGSLEDLWAFNEEQVARAVAACTLPTLSAVGHESDVTICDLVADSRAPTPSAAAVLAVGDREAYSQYLDEQVSALERILLRRLKDSQGRLDQLRERYAFRQPIDLFTRYQLQLQQLAGSLGLGVRRIVTDKSQGLAVARAGLMALNPKQVLERGYVIVTDDQAGKPVTRRMQLSPRQALTLHLADGTAGVTVTRLDEAS